MLHRKHVERYWSATMWKDQNPTPYERHWGREGARDLAGDGPEDDPCDREKFREMNERKDDGRQRKNDNER